MVGDTVCDAVCVSIMIRYALFGVRSRPWCDIKLVKCSQV